MAKKKYPCQLCGSQNLKQALKKCTGACDTEDEDLDDFVFSENETSGKELLNLDEQ